MFIPRKEVIKSGTVWDLDVINQITYQGVPFIPGGNATDELVKITAADTTAGYLGAKVAAGTGIQLTTTNPGANETLTIACTVVDLDVKVKVSANDTTAGFLNGKLVAGTGITFTENNDGGNETLTVTLGSHTHAASDITSGVLGTARLASTGTASASTYLRGDQAWSGLDAGHITTGTVPTARLATGTANSTTYLRGDQTWQTISTGVTGFTPDLLASGGTPWTATDANARLLATGPSSNISISLQPKNAGSLTADRADNTTTGGNLRGQYAVDWQFGNRSQGADRVASGNYSVVSGGVNNRAGAVGSTVSGGNNNRATQSYAVVSGGTDNQAVGTYSTIAGGAYMAASSSYAVAVGGLQNTASSQYTGVLSGSYNYVQSDYSVVLGGTSNGTTLYSNYSFVGGGQSNAIGNSSNDAYWSVIGGGASNTIIARYGIILGGDNNYVGLNNGGANSLGGVILGGSYAFTNRLYQRAFAAGRFSNRGDAQTEWYDVRRVVTTSSWTALTVDGAAPNNYSNTIRIMPSSVYTFQALISAVDGNGTSTAAGYKIEGMITNLGGTVALLGTPVVTTFGETLSGMDVRAVADTTNGALSIEFAGSSGYSMWVHAHVTLVKSSFA